MSKAVLVLNKMPECCLVCPLCDAIEGAREGYGFCLARKASQRIEFAEHEDRPDWCPLQELEWYRPRLMDTIICNDEYLRGWNHCLNELES